MQDSTQFLQRYGMVVMVLVEMMMMMMILMKPSLMTVSMGMISPLREGISPADFCLSESFFCLCSFRPAEAAEYFYDGSRVLGFRGIDIRDRAVAEVDQCGHTTWPRGLV